jgi:hypothetical protein
MAWLYPQALGDIFFASWVSYITTDGQSASLSWCQAPIWGIWPDFYYYQTIARLLSDEREGLSFTMYIVQYMYILHNSPTEPHTAIFTVITPHIKVFRLH